MHNNHRNDDVHTHLKRLKRWTLYSGFFQKPMEGDEEYQNSNELNNYCTVDSSFAQHKKNPIKIQASNNMFQHAVHSIQMFQQLIRVNDCILLRRLGSSRSKLKL